MQPLKKNAVAGLIGGLAGLAAMEIVRWATAPLVKQRPPKPTDVFATAKSMSAIGVHHAPDEPATTALGRIAYEKIVGHPPPAKAKEPLSWAVHITYGLAVAAAYGIVRGRRAKHVLRDGVVFGTALWLFGDELAVPLLGLADKPTEYHRSQHLQSLAQHVAFGAATVAATRAVQRVEHRR